jgi:membrane protein implicated in regulation of membrane protease activity
MKKIRKFDLKPFIDEFVNGIDYIGSLGITILIQVAGATYLFKILPNWPGLAGFGLAILMILTLILWVRYIVRLNSRPLYGLDDVMGQLTKMEEDITQIRGKL